MKIRPLPLGEPFPLKSEPFQQHAQEEEEDYESHDENESELGEDDSRRRTTTSQENKDAVKNKNKGGLLLLLLLLRRSTEEAPRQREETLQIQLAIKLVIPGLPPSEGNDDYMSIGKGCSVAPTKRNIRKYFNLARPKTLPLLV